MPSSVQHSGVISSSARQAEFSRPPGVTIDSTAPHLKGNFVIVSY